MFSNRWGIKTVLAVVLALLLGTQTAGLAATTGITLEVKKVTITIGDTYSVPYTLAGEAPDPVTLKSAKPAVVQVVNDRDVLALKAGKSKITVKSGAKKAVLTVTVVPPAPQSVTIDAGEITLKKGETRKLVATVLPAAANQKVGWKSSNKKIATVTAKGAVKGVGAGECTITCTTKTGKLTATAAVSVEETPKPDPTPTPTGEPMPTPTPAPTTTPTPGGGNVTITRRGSLPVVVNMGPYGKPESVDYLLTLKTNNTQGPLALEIYNVNAGRYMPFTTKSVVKNATYDMTVHYTLASSSSTIANLLSIKYNGGKDTQDGGYDAPFKMVPESVKLTLAGVESDEDVVFSDDKKTLVKYNTTKNTHYTVPDGVLYIADNAFRGHGELVSITLPEGLQSTGEYCFRECRALKTINLPKSLTSAEHCMFAFCDRLDDVTIPASLKTLTEWMFDECTSLTRIIVPEGVTTIENYVFYGCTALRELTLPASITSIKGEDVFYGCSPDLVVTGKAGSAVEKYCNAHGVTFVSAN